MGASGQLAGHRRPRLEPSGSPVRPTCEDPVPTAAAKGSDVQVAHDSMTRNIGARSIVSDALPANRIFHLAAYRFDRALTAMAVDPRAELPSTDQVLEALEQAQHGATLLGSALVPSVTFVDQQRALGAIAQANAGIDELHELVSLTNGHAAPVEQRQALDAARGFLDVARAILSTDET